jgi:hypothetical protein
MPGSEARHQRIVDAELRHGSFLEVHAPPQSGTAAYFFGRRDEALGRIGHEHR